MPTSDSTTQTPPAAQTQSATQTTSPQTTDATQSNNTIVQLQAKIANLETQVKAFQEAAQRATSERDTLQQSLKDAQAQIQDLTGQIETRDQATQALTQQLQELTSFKETAEPKLKLFELIQENPNYHNLVPMLDAIRVVPDPDEQKKILDTVAAAQQAAAKSAVQSFQAGSGLPTTPQTQPAGDEGPKTYDEAIQKAYESLNAGNNERFNHYLDLAMQLQAGARQEA